MERHADICGRPSVAFAPAAVEHGGVRIGDVLYGSVELERRIEACGGWLSASATVDPADDGAALVVLHDTFEIVRVEMVVSASEFTRHLSALDAVLDQAADILGADR